MAAVALYWWLEPAAVATTRRPKPGSRHHWPAGGFSRRSPWLPALPQSRRSARPPPPFSGLPASSLPLRCWQRPSPMPQTPAAAEPKAAAASAEAPDAERFFQSIVKVRARAVPNARSSATLGQEREGTGVVIGDDGLIVTVGYLIVEADEVSLVDQQGRVLPARVVAYDHATGLGLVRAIVPLAAPPLPLGESAQARRPRSRDDRQPRRRRRRDARATSCRRGRSPATGNTCSSRRSSRRRRR